MLLRGLGLALVLPLGEKLLTPLGVCEAIRFGLGLVRPGIYFSARALISFLVFSLLVFRSVIVFFGSRKDSSSERYCTTSSVISKL